MRILRSPGNALGRAFFVWQFASAAVLPLWVLLGYALWGHGLGGLFGLALLAPLLVVVELALAVLFSARASVRRPRVLDGRPMAVLAVFHLAVIGLGFFGPATAWFGVLAITAALGAGWLGSALLAREIRERMRATLAGLGVQPPQRGRAPVPIDARPLDGGEYVVVQPGRPRP
jgi:hypothetical protein